MDPFILDSLSGSGEWVLAAVGDLSGLLKGASRDLRVSSVLVKVLLAIVSVREGVQSEIRGSRFERKQVRTECRILHQVVHPRAANFQVRTC